MNKIALKYFFCFLLILVSFIVKGQKRYLLITARPDSVCFKKTDFANPRVVRCRKRSLKNLSCIKLNVDTISEKIKEELEYKIITTIDTKYNIQQGIIFNIGNYNILDYLTITEIKFNDLKPINSKQNKRFWSYFPNWTNFESIGNCLSYYQKMILQKQIKFFRAFRYYNNSIVVHNSSGGKDVKLEMLIKTH
jgi:hypothetical protein